MRPDILLAPQTPAAQNPGEGLSQFIKGTIADAVRGALTEARDAAISDRDEAQRLLSNAKSAPERATLQLRLDKANAKVDKLNADIAKAEANLPPAAPRAPAAPSFPAVGFAQDPPFGPDQVPTTMIISVVGLIFVGFPLAIAFARLLWKRGSHVSAPPPSQLPADSTRRFDQLEHAVDAIAIEVERISENQRYLTKLLSEPRPNAAVGAGRGGPPPAS